MNKDLAKLIVATNDVIEHTGLSVREITIKNCVYEFIIMVQFENGYRVGLRLNSIDITEYEIPQLVFIINDYINNELSK